MQAWSSVHADDFAVVWQPVTSNMVIPNEAYQSKLDCLHPSGLASTCVCASRTATSLNADVNLAVGLWNNMISPAASKVHGLVPNTPPLCAQQDTLLYTT